MSGRILESGSRRRRVQYMELLLAPLTSGRPIVSPKHSESSPLSPRVSELRLTGSMPNRFDA